MISSGFTFPFDTTTHGVLLAVSPVFALSGPDPCQAAGSSTLNAAQIPTLMLTTSTGALQLVKQEGSEWTREESLADIIAVRFVDLGEPEVEEVRHAMSEEGFAGRLIRHVLELRVDILTTKTKREC